MTRQSLCDITTDNSCPHCKQTQKHLMFERVRRLHFERQVKIEMDRNAKLLERIRDLENNLNSEKKKLSDDKANKFPLTVSNTAPSMPNIPKLQISEKILEIGATGTKLNPLSDICHGILLTEDEFASPRTATSISNLESPFSTAYEGNISFAQIDSSATAAHWILDRILSLYRRERDETFKNIGDVNGYAEKILQLCKQTREKLAHAPLFLTLHSPLYILGDLHGNFKALEFFITHLIKFGLPTYTGSRLLFLGDYVDRGDASVEVAAVLLALKCLAPDNVILLRGNHETAECLNSRSYGKWGFSAQCRQRFGKDMGRRVFVAFAEVFTHLPLAASVDGAVFCVHAGIPKPEANETYTTCMNRIKSQFFPRLLSLASSDTDPPELLRDKRLVSGLLWADPAPTSTQLDEQGFGPNPLRGEGSYSFGTSALDSFLTQTGFQCVVRGHQCVQTGLRLCMGGRVVTVFTSSAYCGQSNAAGALYVTQGKLRLVTCRPSCENAKPDVEGTDDLSHKIPGQEEGEEGLV